MQTAAKDVSDTKHVDPVQVVAPATTGQLNNIYVGLPRMRFTDALNKNLCDYIQVVVISRAVLNSDISHLG